MKVLRYQPSCSQEMLNAWFSSPKEGDHVLVSGRISLYEPSGTYSIQVTEMKPDGVGELYLKYEALKKELRSQGLFQCFT
jgi:exonuclease VII large subunit